MSLNYQALLLVSFGGPEGPKDVIPFLENVLRGKNVPRERIREVAHHYEIFDGVSPINQQNRDLIEALKTCFEEKGPDIPIYWGNRNWHPFLDQTIAEMKNDGIDSALALVTSAFGSFSGCRQYLNDIQDARFKAGGNAPRIDKIRLFFNHPKFIEAISDRVLTALGKLSNPGRRKIQLLYTAHSIPVRMATSCEYEKQLRETARLVSEKLSIREWQLVYQSRSGPPQQPWLGPDILDSLREIAASGFRDVVVVPIGFVSDHMEVLYDLDIEAQELSADLGLHMIRAKTVGTHRKFVEMIHDLILERTDKKEKKFLGSLGPAPDICPEDCCMWNR